MKRYDIVIIGSGIGGLTAALVLSKFGKKVCVLEKNQQLGGNLQVFSRDKKIFDTGVHYLGGLDEGENLYQFFKYLDLLDEVEYERLDDSCFDRIILKDGRAFNHAQGYENFTKELINHFPEEKDAILKYCELMQEMCKCFPLYNVELDNENSYLRHSDILEKNAYEVISSLTDNEDLLNVLCGNIALYAGIKETTPFYVHALVINSYIKGAYRVVKGGGQLAKVIAKKIRNYGGEIYKRAEVVSAGFTEDKKVDFVETSDGQRYYADSFISNFHPSLTIELFGEDRFLKAYRKRIMNLENTMSPFIVHLSLKKDTVRYKPYNEYYLRIDDVWENTKCNFPTWPEQIFVSSPCLEKNQQYTDSLSLMAYMPIEWLDEWKDSLNTVVHKNGREETYYDKKKEWENILIDALEEIDPDIRENIENVYSSTPLTFRDYLNNPDGNCYGILKDCNNPARTMINPKTKIRNLYLTGQNIVFHGILGAVVGAFVTSFEFVDRNKVLEDIKNAQD